MTNLTAVDTTNDAQEVLSDEELHAQELATIKRKSVSGVISYFFRDAVLQAVGLAAQLILSFVFAVEDFGIYGFVVQIIGLLVFFSDLGLAAALVQKKTEPTKEDYQTAFTIQQLLSWLIVVACLIIVATGVVQAKTGMVGVWVLLALAISFPLASLKTISSIILERRLEFSKLVVPQIYEQIVFYSVLIFLAVNHYGALAYAYAIIARSVIGVVVMWWIQRWPIGLAFDKASAKSLLNYGAKFQLNDFLARVKDQLFYLCLGLVLPLRQFGYIQWAKTWSQYPYSLTVQNVMAITFPTFSRLQGHKEALQRAIEKSIFIITLAIFPMLVGMAVFIHPALTVFAKYQKWEPAALSFILFTLSIGWAAVSTPLVNTLNAIGEINKSLKLMIMWTVLTWVLTPLAMKFFGYNGVAIAAFVISFTSFLPIIYVKRIVPVRIWENCWQALLGSMAMAAVSLSLLPMISSPLRLLAVMVVGSVAYGLVLLLVARQKIWSEAGALIAHRR